MAHLTPGIIAVVALFALAALLAAHRLASVLEKRGWIYYLHQKPRGGASRFFQPFQEVLDPSARHVVQVHEQTRWVTREDVPGADDPRRESNPEV
ncbi:MAG: hypothetical protein AB7I30_09630 [Isosphaeraceae bacterium]